MLNSVLYLFASRCEWTKPGSDYNLIKYLTEKCELTSYNQQITGKKFAGDSRTAPLSSKSSTNSKSSDGLACTVSQISVQHTELVQVFDGLHEDLLCTLKDAKGELTGNPNVSFCSSFAEFAGHLRKEADLTLLIPRYVRYLLMRGCNLQGPQRMRTSLIAHYRDYPVDYCLKKHPSKHTMSSSWGYRPVQRCDVIEALEIMFMYDGSFACWAPKEVNCKLRTQTGRDVHAKPNLSAEQRQKFYLLEFCKKAILDQLYLEIKDVCPKV